MKKPIGRTALSLALGAMPSLAAAQQDMSHAMRHELGVDVAVLYRKPNGGDGGVLIGTPVDLRVGIMAGDKLVIEPRISFQYNSKGGTVTVGTTTKTYAIYEFIPDVNALWALRSNKKGPYLTAGAGADLFHFVTTRSQFSVNGGVGTRVPYESGAIRIEAFARYFFQNKGDGLASVFTIGARMGISLWH